MRTVRDPRADWNWKVPVPDLVRRIVRAAADSLGYTTHPAQPPVTSPAEAFPEDFTAEEREICRSVARYTMTSNERIVSLIRAVQYVERFRVPGAVVECGVWRGGSMMAIAKMLLALNSTGRELFLFDTYSGMPDPCDADVDIHDRSGSALVAELRNLPREQQAERHVLALCPLENVTANLLSTGYPQERLHFIEGRIENTVPALAPDRIALLRLDTDWYESTRHELTHLFPRLSRHGVLIVDDYGHWRGARRAVDEFLEQSREPIFLSRIDYTGRLAVRC